MGTGALQAAGPTRAFVAAEPAARCGGCAPVRAVKVTRGASRFGGNAATGDCLLPAGRGIEERGGHPSEESGWGTPIRKGRARSWVPARKRGRLAGAVSGRIRPNRRILVQRARTATLFASLIA